MIGFIAGAASLLALAAADAPRIHGTGPYPAVMVAEPGMPDNTAYYPANLSAVKGKLPVIVWTEGGCVNIGNRSAGMLSDWASHGYLVIAAGPISPTVDGFNGRGSGEERLRGANQLSQPSQQRAAIAWADAENARKGGKFHGRIDTSKIAAAGNSCGGVQAIDLAVAEPRVATTLVLYSGLFPDGKFPKSVAYAGTYVLRSDLPKMRRPMLYLYGGPDDIAYPNALQNIESMPDTPVFAASLKGSLHGQELRSPNAGRFGSVSLRWLAWTLKGDQAAGDGFVGPSCTLCTDPNWKVDRFLTKK